MSRRRLVLILFVGSGGIDSGLFKDYLVEPKVNVLAQNQTPVSSMKYNVKIGQRPTDKQ